MGPPVRRFFEARITRASGRANSQAVSPPPAKGNATATAIAAAIRVHRDSDEARRRLIA
jgi:hypothetical protein